MLRDAASLPLRFDRPEAFDARDLELYADTLDAHDIASAGFFRF